MAGTEIRRFGPLLRRYRLATNLTQEELAERAGLSVRGLKYLEQGARQPYPDTIRRLAAALALAPDERASLTAVVASALLPAVDGPDSIAPRPTPLIGRPPEVLNAERGFQVRILGPFALVHDGVPVDAGAWQPRVRSLFLLIVIAPGRRRLRDEAIELLWPAATPEAGSSSLRYTLHMLRRALGRHDPSPVLFEQGWLLLNPVYRWDIDLERFEALAEAPENESAALEQAAALYHDDPLAENRDDAWAIPVRDHAQRTWRDLGVRLGRLYRARGDHQQAAGRLERVLAVAPLDETALQELLALLIEMGRGTDALLRYRRFAARLREELGVFPSPATRALVDHVQTQPGEEPASPPARSPARAGTPTAVLPSYPLPVVGRLVGRDSELARLTAALARLQGSPQPERSTVQASAISSVGSTVAEDRPRLVLLAAEAGMGKTRLLGELAQRAHRAGMLVLAGGCYEQEGRLPYGPFHDALADYVRAQPEMLPVQIGGLEPDLVRILPEIQPLAGEGPAAPWRDMEAERTRLFLAVAQLLTRLSYDRPLLLILDDLHWADDATVQLLHFLLRQPGLGRVLLLGAYRSEEVSGDAPLVQLVCGAGVRERIEDVMPAPLSSSDLAALLQDRLGGVCSGSLVEVLHDRSEGNPFFVLQMLRLLQEEGGLERVEDGWRLGAATTLTLPPAVRDTITRRLRRLTRDGREVLMLGAVLGRGFGYAQLDRLWQGEERTLFESLDAALDAQLLDDVAGGYAFRHPLLWEVVYHRVPTPRRAILHERAALKLEEFYGERAADHAAELAHHFVSAGRVHIDRAIRYLVAAGDQAEHASAHAEGAEYYRRALELTRQHGQRGGAAVLLEKLGAALKAAGRLDGARDALEEAAESYRERGDPDGEGRVVALLGLVHYFRVSIDEGAARLEPVVARLEQQGATRGLALLYAALPRVYLPAGRYTEGLAAAERAVELANALGDTTLIPDAIFVRGRALLECGRVEESIPVLHEAIRLAEALPDLFVLTAACNFVGEAYMACGAMSDAGAYMERSTRAAERRGGLDQMGGIWRPAEVCLLLGDWAAARRYAAVHLEAVHARGSKPAPNSLGIRGMLALYEGDWEDARAYLEECATLTQRGFSLSFPIRARGLLAELALLQGQSELAMAQLEPLLNRPGQQERVDVLMPLAWSQLEVGNPSEARETVATAIRTARQCRPYMNDAPLLADALWVQGMICARQGCLEEAEQSFRAAVLAAQSLPYPYGEARALYEWGRMEAARGARDQALERYAAGLVLFRRLGARPYIDHTEQALLALQRG